MKKLFLVAGLMLQSVCAQGPGDGKDSMKVSVQELKGLLQQLQMQKQEREKTYLQGKFDGIVEGQMGVLQGLLKMGEDQKRQADSVKVDSTKTAAKKKK